MEPKRIQNEKYYGQMELLLNLARDSETDREAFKYFNLARRFNNFYGPSYTSVSREIVSRERRRRFENNLDQMGIFLEDGIEGIKKYLEDNVKKYVAKALKQRRFKNNHPKLNRILKVF